MAAKDFVKVAAGQLHRAAFALKQEAQSMRAERERKTREKATRINEAELKLKAKQTMLYDPNMDDREKQQTARVAGQLQQQIQSDKRELQEVTQRLAQEADKKNSQAKSLDGRAGELESSASSL